jgi:hypothetical protein
MMTEEGMDLHGPGDVGPGGVGGDKEVVTGAQSDEAGWTTVQPSKPSKPKVSRAEMHVVYIAGNACNITRVCPIDFNKKLVAEIGAIDFARVTGSSIKVFCANEEQKARLLYTSQIGDIEIVCSGPRNSGRATAEPNQPRQPRSTPAARTTRGVIVGVWDAISEEDVASETKAEKATRITKTVGGRRIRTTAMILDFGAQQLPDHVCIGYRRYKVNLYTPPPTRCYRCQAYGHRAAFCRSSAVCPKCAGPHKFEDCTKAEKLCINCQEPHSAAFKGCKGYQKAVAISHQALTQGLTYAAAARRHAAVERQVVKEQKAAETAIATQLAVAGVISPAPAPVSAAEKAAAPAAVPAADAAAVRVPVAAARAAVRPAVTPAVTKRVATNSVEIQTDAILPETAQIRETQTTVSKKRRRGSQGKQGQLPAVTAATSQCSTDSDSDGPMDAASFRKVSKPTITHSSLMDFLKQLTQLLKNGGGKLDLSTVAGVQEVITRTLGVEVTDSPKGTKTQQSKGKSQFQS